MTIHLLTELLMKLMKFLHVELTHVIKYVEASYLVFVVMLESEG